MPIVELHLLEGYSPQDKQRLGTGLTQAVRSVVPAAPEAITVMIHDMPTEDYYRGGTTRTGAPALPDPIDVVRYFLQAMQDRDLETASALLHTGFEMYFPGTPVMHRLSELIAWAAPRYQYVTKSYDGFDALQGAGETAIVYCRGHLAGAWTDGRAFDGIRFIDRFEIIGGRIVRQDVWNDIAEIRNAEETT